MTEQRKISKEELTREKFQIDKELSELKLALKAGAAQFNQTGRGLSTDRLFKIHARIDTLKVKSQEIQLEISIASDRDKRVRAMEMNKTFMEVARRELDKETFDSIRRKAQETI